jgi:hypothetical protein
MREAIASAVMVRPTGRLRSYSLLLSATACFLLGGCGGDSSREGAPAGTERDSPTVEARRAAESYMRALARNDAQRVCSLWTRHAIRELLSEASARNRRSCPLAFREVFGKVSRILGRVPIASVRARGRYVLVTVSDAQYSDSGNDTFRMIKTSRGWRVSDP